MRAAPLERCALFVHPSVMHFLGGGIYRATVPCRKFTFKQMSGK